MSLAAPPAVFAAPAADPHAPGAVFAATAAPHFPPFVTVEAGRAALHVGGTLAPDATGTLLAVALPAATVFPGGKEYTSTGLSGHPPTGRQVRLYQSYLVTPAQTTLALLAPIAGYTSGDFPAASYITITDAEFSSVASYFLHDNGGSPQWQLGGGDASSHNSLVIPAGALVFPVKSPGIGFVGGLGATWQADAATQFSWNITVTLDDEAEAHGAFTGIGTTPITVATWAAQFDYSGTPTVALP